MQVKRYNDQLYIFEKSTGMTGIFSGKEEQLLLDYVKSGVESPFIHRLYKLGILKKSSCKQEIINVIEEKHSNLRLDALHIDITTTCPLACPQCYKSANTTSQITLDKFKCYIDEADKLKVFQIAIGGGEPLLHPQIINFVEYIANTPMSATMTTSGYGLTKELLNKLIKVGLNHVQISLNSIKESVNKKSRDGFYHAIHALELLSNTEVSFGINMVIRKDNLQTFIETVEYAKKMGAENINILRYKPSTTEEYLEHALSNDEFYKLANRIKQIRGIKVKVDSAYSKLLIYLNNGRVNKERSGCMASKSFIAISPDGLFKPCSHLSIEEKADSIYEYYTRRNTARSMEYKRYHTDSLCYTCLYLQLCGGCVAISEFLYKDGMSGEKKCPVYCYKHVKG